MPAPKLRFKIPNHLTVEAEGHFAVATVAIFAALAALAWIAHLLHYPPNAKRAAPFGTARSLA
jgi:hypothetical protein